MLCANGHIRRLISYKMLIMIVIMIIIMIIMIIIMIIMIIMIVVLVVCTYNHQGFSQQKKSLTELLFPTHLR